MGYLMKSSITVLPFLILAVLAGACSANSVAAVDGAGDGKLNVVATTGMIGDLAINIGGDYVEVTSLMGSGVDPHLYKATAGDVRALEQADIIFYNGLHLEAGMSGVLERMSDQRPTTAVTKSIDPSVLSAPPEFAGAYDPHVWFDVSLWKQAAEVVRDSLIELDPAHSSEYQVNASSYLEELDELDNYVREQIQRIPEERRVLVTAHDAFNYFGQAYGIEVAGLQGISTATEAGTADVQDLASLIVERQIPAIFIESSVPQRNIEAVQAAVEARGFDVRIGGELFSDAMGNPGTPEGTYPGMVRHNVDTIVSALTQE
jgi:manganese/zinc/iron transport system substrate-binding protein